MASRLRLGLVLAALLLAAALIARPHLWQCDAERDSTPERPPTTPRVMPVLAPQPSPIGTAGSHSNLFVVDGRTAAPIPGAVVFAVPPTDAKGVTPAILGRADKTGRIDVRTLSGELLVWAPDFGPRRLDLGEKVGILRDLRVELPPLRFIEGRVVAVDGMPAGGAIAAFVPRGPEFRSWANQLPDCIGSWSESWTEIGFRVVADGEGKFRIAVPETDATLRIGRADQVWVPASGAEATGASSPADGNYHLRAVVRADIDIRDGKSGLEVPGATIAVDANVATKPYFVHLRPDPLPKEDHFVAVEEVLPSGVTSASFKISARALGYAPADVTLELDSSSATIPKLAVLEMAPINSGAWGTVAIRIGDSRPFPGLAISIRPLAADAGLESEFLLGNTPDRTDVLSLPAGRYVLSPPGVDGSTVRKGPRGTLEGYIVRFEPARFIVGAGARSEVGLEFKAASIHARLTYPDGDTPPQLYVGPPGLVREVGESVPQVSLFPAPSDVWIIWAADLRGRMQFAVTGMKPLVVRELPVLGEHKELDLVFERLDERK